MERLAVALVCLGISSAIANGEPAAGTRLPRTSSATSLPPIRVAQDADGDEGQEDDSQPESKWVAFAVGSGRAKEDPDQQRLMIATTRRDSREAAESSAMRRCRAAIAGPSTCKIVNAFNQGCMYITSGKNAQDRTGWASGFTPQRAYDRCQARGLSCRVPVLGDCADTSEPKDKSDIARAAPPRRWIALAGGVSSNFFTARVSIAASSGASKRDAESKAVEACNAKDSGVKCLVAGSFNNGCGYITKGASNGRASWGVGSTAQNAYDNCVARGVSCDTRTIGGCMSN